MAHEFKLADIGEGLTDAEIVRWLVSVGDLVTVDQPLVEVETAKSIVELPSPFGGAVLHLGGQVGTVLEVGAVVAVVGEPGESWSSGSSMAPPVPAEASSPAAPIVGTLSDQAVDLLPVVESVLPEVRRSRAVPLVRKLADELGVDLQLLAGSGPEGRITREDVLLAARSQSPGEGVATSPHDGERRPLSKVRRTIAANMSRAWSEIPIVSAFDDVDVGPLLAARKTLAAHYGVPIPLDALLVAAVIPVLRAFPEFNSTLDGDTLLVHRRHDIGLAVDTAEGLMVAVIADAASRGLPQLAEEVVRVSQGARSRTLTAKELSGQTFTVSNIGATGRGAHGTPLVPPGTTAIVSIGHATDKPVVRDSRIEIGRMMPVSLSYDHRVIDGGMGRRFLAMLAEQLSEPIRLVT